MPAVKKAGAAVEVPVEEAKSKAHETASKAGLGKVHRAVLEAVGASGEPATYQDIKARSGYYANLTKVLRNPDPDSGSLVALGLAKEVSVGEKGSKKFGFTITAKGKKTLAKAA